MDSYRPAVLKLGGPWTWMRKKLQLYFSLTSNWNLAFNCIMNVREKCNVWFLENKNYLLTSVNITVYISTVKPTRCTNVSNLFYFGMKLYMFRTVFPPIISSSRLYIQQQAFVRQILLSACWQADSSICLTSTQQYLFDICLLLYVQSWTADDGGKGRPKHVPCYLSNTPTNTHI